MLSPSFSFEAAARQRNPSAQSPTPRGISTALLRLRPTGARLASPAEAPVIGVILRAGRRSPWRGSGWSPRLEPSSYGRFLLDGSSHLPRRPACLRALTSSPLFTASGGAGTCFWFSPTPTTSPCNADGLGNIRKEELYNACATLKIPAQQVEVLDHQKLQDGFHEKWDHGLLAELTMERIQLWDIDTIVTFDSCGVSGHPNHRDVHHGICKLLHENQEENIEAWKLVSLNIFRKYSGPVDIWLSSLISFSSSKQPIYSLVNSRPSRSFQAMAAHRSQWVWFRRLFVLFSSYTYINMLQKI